MIRRITLILIGLLTFATPLQAGTYLGLTPGKSTRSDADRVLGSPIKEIEKAVQYDYEPKKHDAKRISIVFEKETREIKTISLYFQEPYDKKHLTEWLGLGQPVRVSTEDGRRVEYYDGIALYYTSPEDSSPVEYFSHFIPSPTSAATKGEVVTLGLVVTSFDHHDEGIRVWDTWPGSAAELAGFKAGDIILQMGPHRLDRADIPIKDFVDLVRMLPTDTATPFLIRRKSTTFTVHVTPERKTVEDMKVLQEKLVQIALRYYQEGLVLLRKDSLFEATAHFKKAIGFDPTKPEYFIKLAETYELSGQLDSALYFYKQAYALNHDYEMLLAIGKVFQLQGKTDEAIYAYREAIRVRPKEDSSRKAEKMLEAILRKN